MPVTPSPIGGFAAQFFDNNGVILSGGKIYTYASGTTTPQAAYTSASGATPHANPIILDSAGRVPGGEIWLTDGLVYKFVIETATSILIGTYDNITGVNSNFVSYTIQEEVITATAGQTVFNLATINYAPATNSLSVYIDGVNQYVGDSYLETDSTTVTFTAGVHVGGEVKFTTAIQTTTGAVDASIVTYDPPFTGGVITNVEAKLAQYVSVKDFGAVGDGVTDDTAAIQAALDAVFAAGGGRLYLPRGDYLVTSISKTWASAVSIEIEGASAWGTILRKTGATTTPILDLSASVAPTSTYCTIKNLRLVGNAKAHDGLRLTTWARFRLDFVSIEACDVGLDNRGSLVFSAHSTMLRLNNTGYKANVSSAVGANLIQFYGGVISANTTLGVDIVQSNGFSFYGVDMSGNGTTADVATGAVRIRSTTDDEIGVAYGAFDNCWFEVNKGWTIYAEPCELNLTISNTQITGPEGNRAIYTGDIRGVELRNVICPSSGDEAQINAKNFLCFGGRISIITNNSTVSSAVFGTTTQIAGTGIRAKQFTPQIGDSTSYGIAPGVVSKQAVAIGNVDTGQDNLMSYSLPANAFSSVGQALRVTAWGTTANNANAKTIKLFFAGTEIATLSLTTSQANAWRIDGEIMWRASGLATCAITLVQGGVVMQSTIIATTVASINAAIANPVQITGQGTASSDVLQRGMLVEYIA